MWSVKILVLSGKQLSWPTEGKACKTAKIYFSENVKTSKLCSSFCGKRTQQNSSKNAKENSLKISSVNK